MKKLLLSTAILAASTLAVSAQDNPFRADADPMAIHASEFIGMRVYASEAALDAEEYAGLQDGWEDIGEINDVILSRDGQVDSVLVDIGGFLGIGERQVAVDMSAIRFVSDSATGDVDNDFFLVMNANRATFEGAPAYPAHGDAMDDQAAADADVATDTDVAAADATQDPVTEVVNPEADAPEAMAEGETVTEGETVAEAGTPAREPILRDGYGAVDRATLTAEVLTGAKVYDANDEWIGDVSDLVITPEGQVTEAVVDVGGFLGIGAKPVALTMDQIDILRQNDGDEVRVYVPMTKDELQALPDYTAG